MKDILKFLFHFNISIKEYPTVEIGWFWLGFFSMITGIIIEKMC